MGHKHTEKTKLKLSIARKKYLKENPDKNISFKKRWNRQPSYPEQWFKKVIDTEFTDKNYIQEMQFFQYSLDFAWPEKQLCIEIDGRQHEDRIETDKRKDNKLIENNWKVLRIKWNECCLDSEQYIKIAKAFVDDSQIIPFEKRFKTKKEEYKEYLITKYGTDTPRKQLTKIKKERLSLLEKYNRFKEGWITNFSKETGIHRNIVVKLCKEFQLPYKGHASPGALKIKKEKIYKRKLSKEQIIEIKKLYVPRHREFGSRALAKKFNTTHTIIQRCINQY